jgi:predicted RNA-binding Zn-ribbon protein involved in translation (DUF1610 family)
VAKASIRRLYESDACGLLDEELLADVGTRLYQRCLSILEVYEARHGRVRCPVCTRAGRETVMARVVEMTCPVCGWRITWREYARTFKRRQLNSGGALSVFRAFLHDWPAARTAELKMASVDQLIHGFHYSFRDRPTLPSRPVGPNLIHGKLEDVIRFLDGLSAGPDHAETRQEWAQTLATYRKDYLGGMLGREEEED